MVQHNAQVRLDPAGKTIHVGVIQIRFLVTGAESNGSVAIFELIVPAGAKLPAPAHSHDAFKEWCSPSQIRPSLCTGPTQQAVYSSRASKQRPRRTESAIDFLSESE